MKYFYNLQMFAEGLAPQNLNPNQAFTGGNFDGEYNTNIAPEVNKVFYQGLLLDEAGPKLVFNQFGQKAKINRSVAEWRKFEALANAKQLTEGITPDGSALKMNTVTAQVKQFGDYVTTTDIVSLVSIDPIVSEATKVLGNSAGISVDTLTRNALVGGTNVILAGGVSDESELTAEHRLSRAEIIRGVRQLRRENTPTIDGSYVIVIHPDNEADLMLDTAFVDAYKYADKTMLFEGEIGKIQGARVVVSTQTKIWKKGDLGVYGCLMFGADAYGVVELEGGGMEQIVKPLGSGGSADPLNQRATVGTSSPTPRRFSMTSISFVSSAVPRTLATLKKTK